MYVEFDIPQVQVSTSATSRYWLQYYFRGSPSQDAEINALANIFMRLAEAAVVEYDLGAKAFKEVWADTSSVGLRSMNRAIAHYESCILDANRAINCYRRLRRHKSQDPLSVYVAKQKPKFATDAIAGQIRDIRNTIHHFEDMLLEGQIPQYQSIAIRPLGTEIQHPTEAGQTIMIFNRLDIGSYSVTFRDLAKWLEEISNIAEEIAHYQPPSV